MHEHGGHVRQHIHIDMGAVPQKDLLRAIELFRTEVRPLVQRALGRCVEGGSSFDELMGRVDQSVVPAS